MKTKTIQINTRTGVADLERKARQAAKFLNKGHKVMVEATRRHDCTDDLFTLTDLFAGHVGPCKRRLAGGTNEKRRVLTELY
jgi:hypothetical protein